MLIDRVLYRDIKVDTEFIADWEGAPKHVRNRVDWLLKVLSITGHFPNSMNIHRAHGTGDRWIGYVTRSKAHWRIIFRINGSHVVFIRLLKHDEMDIYLKGEVAI